MSRVDDNYTKKLEWLCKWGSFSNYDEMSMYPWSMTDVLTIMDGYAAKESEPNSGSCQPENGGNVAEINAKLAEAEEEIADLKRMSDGQSMQYHQLRTKLDRAREALKKYGQHLDSCCCRAGHELYADLCDCGLDEALKEIT